MFASCPLTRTPWTPAMTMTHAQCSPSLAASRHPRAYCVQVPSPSCLLAWYAFPFGRARHARRQLVMISQPLVPRTCTRWFFPPVLIDAVPASPQQDGVPRPLLADVVLTLSCVCATLLMLIMSTFDHTRGYCTTRRPTPRIVIPYVQGDLAHPPLTTGLSKIS